MSIEQTLCPGLWSKKKRGTAKSMVTRISDVNYVLPRKGGNSPLVPRLGARDREGVDGGAVIEKEGGAGETTVRLHFSCPNPHILPTLRQLPPHPAQPGAGSSCGGMH
jgi:hypothetical protein